MDLLLSLLLIPFAVPLALGFVTMCCCAGGCTTYCSGSTDSMQVTVSNVVNGTCTGCAFYNSTFTLTRAQTGCTGITDACGWTFNNGPVTNDAVCITDNWCVNVAAGQSGADFITTVTGGDQAFGVTIHWTFRYNHGTSAPDCSAFSGLSPTFVSDHASCDASGATVLVTSL